MSAIEYISSVPVTADAATVSFSGIPSNYSDLILVGVAYTKFTSAGNAILWLRAGNSTIDTGTNYSVTYLTGNGTTASSTRTTSASYIEAVPTTATTASTTTIYHPFSFQFMSFSNTAFHKTIVSSGGTSENRLYSSVGLWRSNSAITNITVGTDATSIMAGSVFTLWGVK